MHFVRSLVIAALIIAALATAAAAESLVLASGAGYKKMVNALNDAYTQKTGQTLDLIYGNMARVTTLAKESGKVDIVLGDENFLVKAGLPMTTRQKLGRGKLVLAFAKSSQFSKLEDLDNDKAGRIAMPDTKKAIYGKAAREFLQSTGRLPAIQPRLIEVATIPQVFSYLTTNEVDMGFLNLTHALNVKDKLGGFIVLDENAYSPIYIIAGVLDDCTDMDQAKSFLDFLQTPEAKKIIEQNGL
ncbi:MULTISPECIES: molybdate ABC transporter substrate-binding protein [unclassified Pseudodesulfovibrio]|uniref:molybdate ABC transporter substrate-binding protein n=1 Tax=unclassified Pseudodesulfovibrio TaxID=2661612 RepID=UPI000FEBEB49|nr:MULTISPECIES: molybdate ABC transporter substrate-binding protein [unclassified Pseudodesulfovibrio]MCJ2164775.1 molybdate ABC transporter substrate-binding protein [Pseudodesulfovibrio sp. S3-i]RWU04041.1 molybdate ABC transporter substrate-binding protein [Pseudodesulfovibrio sp. S3]